jgi:hypothetical protein
MVKKYGLCALILLLVAHGTALSMMHTRKIVKNTSRLQLQKRVCSEGGLIDHVGDAAFLRKATVSDNWMNEKDRELIRKAHIDSIYKVAQVEAMCKITANQNLDHFQKMFLRDQVPYIVKE